MKLIELINLLKEYSDEDQHNLEVTIQAVEIDVGKIYCEFPRKLETANLHKIGSSLVFCPKFNK